MFQPKYMVLDFETALTTGEPSLDYYREDFRAISCAFAWRDENQEIDTYCAEGEDEIRDWIDSFPNTEFIVHNYAFDEAVIMCRMPEFKGRITIDTMRLCQLVDNGGKDFVIQEEKLLEDVLSELEGKKLINGLSLEACNSRLGDKQYYRHKEPFKKLMVERGGTKSSFDLLTKEELYQYNVLDAIVTLDLYERSTSILKERKIDWSMDHILYKTVCNQTILSKCRGVLVDKIALDRHIVLSIEKLASIESNFRQTYLKEIEEIEAEMLEIAFNEVKMEKTKEGIRKDPPKFNINSPKQLTHLFINKLGLKPRFFTKKDAPSFDAKLLWQYGEAGRLLMGRGRAILEKNQGVSLKELSKYDGRWHPDIKVASTKSGRLSGGSSE